MAVSGFVWAWATYLFLWVIAKNTALSLAIPILVGGIGVGGVIAGVLMFGESLNVLRIAGILIVLAGSVLLARS
jgi:multidrug transporter EmrE-like cation transporter